MLDVIQKMLDGKFEPNTFLVKIHPMGERFDPSSFQPDNYSVVKVDEKDYFLFADQALFLYYKNQGSDELGAASFTLIFRRSELNQFIMFSLSSVIEIIAYNVNASLTQIVYPFSTDWQYKTGFPFSPN